MTTLALVETPTTVFIDDEGHISVVVVDDVTVNISETGAQGPQGPAREAYPFTMMGEVFTDTGDSFIVFDSDYSFVSFTMAVRTAPTGADLIVDLNLNDVSIFADQADRPRILDGELVSDTVTADLDVVEGDRFSLDVDQVGSSYAGFYLTGTARWLAV